MNLASEAVFAIFVLFALQDLHVGKSFYGLLFVVYAVGALVGSAGATRIRDGVGDGPAVFGAIVLFGAPFLVMGISSNGYAVAGTMLVIGAGEAVWGVLTISLRQAVIPSHLLGRVLNVFRLAGWGSLSLGAVIGGGVAHAFGLRVPIMAAGCLILLSAAAAGPALTTRRIQAARALAERTS
jgi:MFS family permease